MNAKGDLIAKLLSLGQGAPVFDVTTSGPAHDRVFRATVSRGGQPLGSGEARSKRDAERLAAEVALRGLGPGHREGEAGGGPVVPAGGPVPAPTAVPAPTPPLVSGPWPIYSPVLAGALDAALELCPEDATVDEVRAEAARLYRDLLADLGHGPE